MDPVGDGDQDVRDSVFRVGVKLTVGVAVIEGVDGLVEKDTVEDTVTREKVLVETVATEPESLTEVVWEQE